MRACTQEFAAEKKQGKDCAMQRHEQVLPPCRCIAQIDPGESVPAEAIACRWGVGGVGNRQNWQGSAPQQTSLAFLFWGLRFRKRGKLPERLRKKKKKADSKTANLLLGENKG